jgi:hypothetical protein
VRRKDRNLLDLFERLAPEQQERLIAFAEFLAEGATDATSAVREPVAIPRAPGETVTMAIRRLVRTYPMLDRRKLMVEASGLLAQHALEGRAAGEVIDDLEALFARHYKKLMRSAE